MVQLAKPTRRGRKARLILLIAGLALVALVAALALPRGAPNTLDTLRQVDPYPLYTMTYYDDYDLDRLLRGGGYAQEWPQQDDNWACTCFCALNPEGDLVFGRNFDWFNRPSLVLFTDPPDGHASVSMVDLRMLGVAALEPGGSGPKGLSPAERQRLLSAPYRPIDGLNEQGLAIGLMAVPDAQPSRDPQKVTIEGLLAIRLVLDRAGDVGEAAALLRGYNLDFGGGPPLHYLIADSSGSSAVVEFVDGQTFVLPNREPWQVATNFVIHQVAPEGADAPCWRYNRAYTALQRAGGSLSPAEAMDLLQSVSQGHTMWSAVYNMTSGDVQVVMGRNYQRVNEFRLSMTYRTARQAGRRQAPTHGAKGPRGAMGMLRGSQLTVAEASLGPLSMTGCDF